MNSEGLFLHRPLLKLILTEPLETLIVQPTDCHPGIALDGPLENSSWAWIESRVGNLLVSYHVALKVRRNPC